MTSDVDLSQLAIEREPRSGSNVRAKRHVLSRYVLPALLLLGFAALAARAARDVVFPPHAVTVVPVHATYAPVQTAGTPLFKAAGWVEPRPTPIRVAALAGGVVEQLLVVQDQPVTAGEPIAELIDEDARLSYDRAAADLTLRRAELEEARAALTAATTRLEQPVHLEAPLNEAEAALAKIQTQLENLPFEIRRAEADVKFARTDYDGKQSSRGAVSGRAIDEARSRLESARALADELDRRKQTLTAEQQAIAARRDAVQTALELKADEIKAKDETEARVRAAAARVQQAEVALAEAKLRLDRMTVRAPVDGRVLSLVAEPGTRLLDAMGNSATRDGSTVVTMYRPESLQLRVDVRFEDIPKVALGQPVRIDSPAVAQPLEGRVLFISSEADIQKNTLQVKVAIDRPPAVFKPEMLVDVTFLAPPRPEDDSEPSESIRLLIPDQLVQSGEEGPFVWLADQSAGMAHKAAVDVGPTSSDGLIEIRSGLNLSSRVIASGRQGLKDGMRIRITGEEPSTSAAAANGSFGSRRSTPSRLPAGGAH